MVSGSIGSPGMASVTKTLRTALVLALTGALLVAGVLIWTAPPTTSTVLIDQTAPTSLKINEKVRDELLTQLKPHELEIYNPEMSGLAERVHNELLNLPKIEDRGVDSSVKPEDPDGSVSSGSSAGAVKEEQAKETQQDLQKEVKTQEVLESKGEETKAKLLAAQREELQSQAKGSQAKAKTGAAGQKTETGTENQLNMKPWMKDLLGAAKEEQDRENVKQKQLEQTQIAELAKGATATDKAPVDKAEALLKKEELLRNAMLHNDVFKDSSKVDRATLYNPHDTDAKPGSSDAVKINDATAQEQDLQAAMQRVEASKKQADTSIKQAETQMEDEMMADLKKVDEKADDEMSGLFHEEMEAEHKIREDSMQAAIHELERMKKPAAPAAATATAAAEQTSAAASASAVPAHAPTATAASASATAPAARFDFMKKIEGGAQQQPAAAVAASSSSSPSSSASSSSSAPSPSGPGTVAAAAGGAGSASESLATAAAASEQAAAAQSEAVAESSGAGGRKQQLADTSMKGFAAVGKELGFSEETGSGSGGGVATAAGGVGTPAGDADSESGETESLREEFGARMAAVKQNRREEERKIFDHFAKQAAGVPEFKGAVPVRGLEQALALAQSTALTHASDADEARAHSSSGAHSYARDRAFLAAFLAKGSADTHTQATVAASAPTQRQPEAAASAREASFHAMMHVPHEAASSEPDASAPSRLTSSSSSSSSPSASSASSSSASATVPASTKAWEGAKDLLQQSASKELAQLPFLTRAQTATHDSQQLERQAKATAKAALPRPSTNLKSSAETAPVADSETAESASDSELHPSRTVTDARGPGSLASRRSSSQPHGKEPDSQQAQAAGHAAVPVSAAVRNAQIAAGSDGSSAGRGYAKDRQFLRDFLAKSDSSDGSDADVPVHAAATSQQQQQQQQQQRVSKHLSEDLDDVLPRAARASASASASGAAKANLKQPEASALSEDEARGNALLQMSRAAASGSTKEEQLAKLITLQKALAADYQHVMGKGKQLENYANKNGLKERGTASLQSNARPRPQHPAELDPPRTPDADAQQNL